MGEFAATPDMLLTSAIEAGIGIAGFFGVVFALLHGRRPQGFRPLLSMGLLSALTTVVLALLPLTISPIGLPDPELWQICSGLYVVYFVIILIVRLPMFRRHRESAEQLNPYLVAFTYLVLVVGALQIANVLVFKASWPYLLLVSFYVVWSFAGFLSAVWALWNVSVESDDV